MTKVLNVHYTIDTEGFTSHIQGRQADPKRVVSGLSCCLPLNRQLPLLHSYHQSRQLLPRPPRRCSVPKGN